MWGRKSLEGESAVGIEGIGLREWKLGALRAEVPGPTDTRESWAT